MKQTIFKLISWLTRSNEISFDGSRVKLWQVPMILLPMKTVVKLQEELEKQVGLESRSIFYAAGKIQGENGCNILIKKFNFSAKIKDLPFYEEQTNMVGIGKIKLIQKSLKPFSFLGQLNSPNAEAYKKTYHESKIPVCDYTRGLITGALESLTQGLSGQHQQLEGREYACDAHENTGQCIFKVMSLSKWKEEDPDTAHHPIWKDTEVAEARKKQTYETLLRKAKELPVSTHTQLEKFMKKKKLNKPFIYTSKGNLSLFGHPSLLTPIDMFAIIHHIHRKKFGNKVDNIFYEQGEALGQEYAEILHKETQIPKNKPTSIGYYLDLLGIFGLGKVEPTFMDKKTISVNVYGSIGSHQKEIYKKKEKEPFDCYTAGILSGILGFVLDKKIKVKEKKCVVQGLDCCVFECSIQQ